METDFRLFPDQAAEMASRVDALYIFLIVVSAFFTALVCFLILFFVIRYRREAKVNRANPPVSYLLEISWSVVPFILTMVMFVWGALLYFEQRQPPVDADEIYVVGKQWMWKIQHPNGKQEINQLHVPVGRAVRLKMISEDVIHSFYIPAFRVKQDVLPNRYSTLWFKATKPGRYYLFCAEYCGTSHSQMGGYVTVMEPAEYAAWLTGGATSEPPEVSGATLFTQLRCNTCHGQTEARRGPALAGILGRPTQLVDGRRIIADEEYIRESILKPAAKVVAGYQPIMPSYEGQISEEQMFQLISYLKSLSSSTTSDDSAAKTTTEGNVAEPARDQETKDEQRE